MKLGTISIVLVLPALLGALAWHSYVLFLYRVAYRLAWVEENLILSGILGCTYLFLGLCALALTSYYAVRTASKWLIVKMGLSALLTLCSVASFFVGAYLGELWAVTGAKSYLDGVVRSANDYLQKKWGISRVLR
jgi:peptidoglycan biosynthesis protein MviN/MurJ (putative lipid II flippase)